MKLNSNMIPIIKSINSVAVGASYCPLLGVEWQYFAPDSIMWDTLIVFGKIAVTIKIFQITKYLLNKFTTVHLLNSTIENEGLNIVKNRKISSTLQ